MKQEPHRRQPTFSPDSSISFRESKLARRLSFRDSQLSYVGLNTFSLLRWHVGAPIQSLPAPHPLPPVRLRTPAEALPTNLRGESRKPAKGGITGGKVNWGTDGRTEEGGEETESAPAPLPKAHLPRRRGRGQQRRDIAIHLRFAAPHHGGDRGRPSLARYSLPSVVTGKSFSRAPTGRRKTPFGRGMTPPRATDGAAKKVAVTLLSRAGNGAKQAEVR